MYLNLMKFYVTFWTLVQHFLALSGYLQLQLLAKRIFSCLFLSFCPEEASELQDLGTE